MEENDKVNENLEQSMGPDRPPDNNQKVNMTRAGQSNRNLAASAGNKPLSILAGDQSKEEGESKSDSSHNGQPASLQQAEPVDQEGGAAHVTDQVHVQASIVAPSQAEQRDFAFIPGNAPNAAAPNGHGGPKNQSVRQETLDVSDEVLWCTAIAEKNCKVLKELLSKIPSQFWNYRIDGETVLHIAAIQGDLTLAESVLNRLPWTEEVVYESDNWVFNEGGYVAAKTASGKTAQVLALENGHTDVETKILDYVNNMKKISAAGGSSLSNLSHPEDLRTDLQLRLNEKIKEKNCLALLKLLKEEAEGKPKYVSILLKVDMQKVDLKYGNEEGRTLLQIAAMQGCFQLTKLVLDQLCAQTSHADSRLGDYIQAVDDLSGLTALEMADDIIGNRSISEYIKKISSEIKRDFAFERKLRMKLVGTLSDYKIPVVSFEAYRTTGWYTALERGDIVLLKELLDLNSRLLLETCHGLTVLHVAVLWDDLGLVKAVVKLFGDSKEIEWGDSCYPPSLNLQEMIAADRKISFDKLQFPKKYWKVESNTELSKWEELPPNILKQLKRGGNSVSWWAEQLKRNQIQAELSATSKVPDPNANVHPQVSQGHLPLPSGLRDIFKIKWDTTPLWMAEAEEFKKDVDFNFEIPERQDWLRFHYACKDPLKFKGLLEEMANYINKNPYDGHKLFHMCDAQGRTPFHILLGHCTDQKHPGWPFDEIFKDECYKKWIQSTENARGKRIIDIVLTKNYLQRNISLEPWKYFKLDFKKDNFERQEIATLLYYQAAFLLKQTNVVEEIWSRFLVKENIQYNKAESNSMLFNAASTGNQTYLQLLLRTQPDLTIIDDKGRSLLHHAADATLRLPQVVANCSLTVQDVSDVRKKQTEQIYFSQLVSSTNMPTYPSGSSAANLNSQDIVGEERSNVGRKACIQMLLQAGVDLGEVDEDGKVPSIGPTIDAAYQSWWYDTVVKDSTDRRNGFSQAGNALSVVGTLVAATSYIGPLQPPMGYNDAGFAKTTDPLVKVFMVSNSLAFYLAMASVMFAVVSSLPMPRESMMVELKRAKHVVSFSLCLLLIAIGSIILSFATISIVTIQNEHAFRWSDLLFGPSIIGWLFCFLGIGGFFIRVARLMYYKNPIIRKLYQTSFSDLTAKCLLTIIGCPFLFLLIVFYYPLITMYLIFLLTFYSFYALISSMVPKKLAKWCRKKKEMLVSCFRRH